MDNKGRKFRLVGFINPYCVMPAFVYPVFMHSNQYYFEDGDGYRIKDFVCAGEFLRKNQFCPVEDSKLYSVGDETIYAYQDDCVTYGNGKMMRDFLMRILCKNTNELLSKEIKGVLAKITEDIDQANRPTFSNERFTEVTIRGINQVKTIRNTASIKAHINIQNVDGEIIVPNQGEHASITIEPSKALIRRDDLMCANLEYRHYSSLVQHYSQLLTEFYILYESLAKMRQPSLEWFHLYDLDFCNRFIQIIILQSGVNFREEDLFTIYQRLNFKNKRYYLCQEKFRSEKALQIAIRNLSREAEKQMKVNTLFCKIIDSSPRDAKIDTSRFDIKYLEEV